MVILKSIILNYASNGRAMTHPLIVLPTAKTNTQVGSSTPLKSLYSLTISVMLLIFILVSVGTPALANSANSSANNPYTLVEQVANATLKRINTEQTQIKTDANHLKIIVADELMPHIDHYYASRYILHKIKTNKSQRKAFYQAFKGYLTTTYATVFAAFDDQTIDFEQAKNLKPQQARVLINTHVIDKDKPPTPIDFKMRKSKKTGKWKAYDLRANGISLLDSKKAELTPLLRQAGGIEKVIKILNEKAAADIKRS